MTTSDAAAELQKANNILILTHRRPDGDTMGSAAALCRALKHMGKSAFVFPNPEITPRFSYLTEDLLAPEGFCPAYVVSCDVASDELISKNADKYRDKIDLCIDHHGVNTLKAKKYLIEEDSAACGEIVYELIRALKAPLAVEAAEAVYIAVSTDTGCFRYANTKSRTLKIAAACYDAGIDAGEINREIFENKTRARFEIERYVLDNMRFFENGEIALCLLSRSVINQTGATDDDLDNIASLPRQIEGVCAGMIISETKNGNSKISVRTAKHYDAACICIQFGGGGHKRAAGATLKGPPLENEIIVLEAAIKCVRGLL